MINDNFRKVPPHVIPVSSNKIAAHAFQSKEQGESVEMNSRFRKFSSDTEIEESIKMSVPNSTKTKDKWAIDMLEEYNNARNQHILSTNSENSMMLKEIHEIEKGHLAFIYTS